MWRKFILGFRNHGTFDRPTRGACCGNCQSALSISITEMIGSVNALSTETPMRATVTKFHSTANQSSKPRKYAIQVVFCLRARPTLIMELLECILINWPHEFKESILFDKIVNLD